MFRLLLIISVALALIIGLSKLTNREAVVSDALEDAAETIGEQVENAAGAAEEFVSGDEIDATDEDSAPLSEALSEEVEDTQAVLDEAADASGQELEDLSETVSDSVDNAVEEGEAAINEIADSAEESAAEASETVPEASEDAAEPEATEADDSANDEDPS